MRSIHLLLASLFLLPLIAQSQCLEAKYDFTGNALDSSSFNRNAVLNGPQLTTDRFGIPNGAYKFDGVNDHILTYHSFDYQYRSVSFWARPTTVSSTRTMLAQDANTLAYGGYTGTIDNGTLKMRAGGASNNYISSNISANQWYHFVLVRNPDSVKYYQNGVLVYSDAANNIGSSSLANPNLVIGSDRTANRSYFQGKLDDIFIYSCELTPFQVDSLYNIVKVYNPPPNPPCMLEARYDFTGNTLDSSGQGRHASLNGAQLTTDRFGTPDGAYEFDGANDHILTNHSFDYQYRSVSFWARPTTINSTRTMLAQDASTLTYGGYTGTIDNGTLKMRAGGANNNYISSNISANQWYHFVLVRNPDSVKYYRNGVLVYSDVANNIGSSNAGNPNLVIGSDRTANRNYFQGKLDDIFIYSCELTPLQVDSLYNIGGAVSIAENYTKNKVIADVYPNPAEDEVFIDLTHSFLKSMHNSAFSISLKDAVGREVKTFVGSVEGNTCRLDVSAASPGVYFIAVRVGSSPIQHMRVILQ